MKQNEPSSRLRVYPPSKPANLVTKPLTSRTEAELDRISGVAPARRVEVSLAEIAPVIADAVANGRGWLADFADDTVQIDADLYEVLLAYQQMRRFNAA